MTILENNKKKNTILQIIKHASIPLLILLFVIVVFWHRIVYVIPAGSSGVLWLAFFGGTVDKFHFNEGIKVIMPWDKIYIYDNRLKRKDISVTAYGKDGLSVTMLCTLSYSLNPPSNSLLHREIGENYEHNLIEPELTAGIARAITSREAKDLYSVKREDIENEIINNLRKRFAQYPSPNNEGIRDFLSLDFFNIREIALPEKVTEAIESKLAAEQAVIEQKYLKDKKEIEAEAVKKFQEIVAPGITDNLLRWQGIEATLKLSQSQNSKIVVIGNGGNGMPLILDGWKNDVIPTNNTPEALGPHESTEPGKK